MLATAAPSRRQRRAGSGRVLGAAVRGRDMWPQGSLQGAWQGSAGDISRRSPASAVGRLGCFDGRGRVTGPHPSLKSNVVVTEVHRPGPDPDHRRKRRVGAPLCMPGGLWGATVIQATALLCLRRTKDTAPRARLVPPGREGTCVMSWAAAAGPPSQPGPGRGARGCPLPLPCPGWWQLRPSLRHTAPPAHCHFTQGGWERFGVC